MERTRRVVGVIGAGAAGLVTARYLSANGFEVIFFERTGEIGGTWVYSQFTDAQLGRVRYRCDVNRTLS